jgi:hypothetical protein
MDLIIKCPSLKESMPFEIILGIIRFAPLPSSVRMMRIAMIAL